MKFYSTVVSVTSESDYLNFTEVIEDAVLKVESQVIAAEKISRGGIIPTEEAEQLYDDIIETLEDINEIIKEPNNAYKFLNAKGVDRIVLRNMQVENQKLRTLALIILKTLFETIPTTTDATVPITTIDKLLDIFENDDNLAMKAHALDVLYIWLPENPRMQVRVMKLKGLEPFYQQVTKLDTSVISTLLDLFNKILQEHIKVRYDRNQKSKMDSEKIILYQRIGLIERMSTAPVCNGLLNIFKTAWPYSNENNNMVVPIFNMVKSMKPYCVKIFKRKNKAIELLETLLEYVQDETNKEHIDKLELNSDDMKSLLNDFVEKLKAPPVKDEF
jgi:hypothetical protein